MQSSRKAMSPWRRRILFGKQGIIHKITFFVATTTILYIYFYNTKLTLRTQKALSVVTTDFIELYIGTCPGRINSLRWLSGPRLGNIHDELPDDAMQHLALFHTITSSNDLLSSLLGQTLCYPQSQFRNVTAPSLSLDLVDTDIDVEYTNSTENDRIMRQWAVKLIYLSLHYHQHQYAIPEAEQRYANAQKNNCLSQSYISGEYNVGRYDYECPGAKYLIMPMGGNGLGANVRGGMVPAMMLGLMTNRVVLFLNNLPDSINTTSDYLRSEWALASCPRKDYQCFFYPVSPCVLLQEDLISQAYYLNVSESRKLVKQDEIPVHVDQYKVWVWHTAFQPKPTFHLPSAEKLYDIAETLLNKTQLFTGYDRKLLHRAMELIRVDDGERDHYNYAAAKLKIQHTITMYMLRPHPQITKQLDAILSDIIPQDYNPEYSIGLPVRASDKCDGESECLSFSQHMTVTGEMWGKHLNRTEIDNRHYDQLQWQPTVVFTTEATNMIAEQKQFVAENQTVSRYPQYNFQYMTNHHDVTPNTGFIRDSEATSHDADAIMISALSSLKAQLLPRLSIGNCCSNFHILLNDFLSEGCGAASTNTFQCIQESEDPLLVVCCGWRRDCRERKKQLLLEMKERNITET